MPALAAVLGLGFALVPLLRDRMFFYWDNAHQHYPQTVFLHEALRHGTIPQWFPSVGFGFPIVAEGQAAHYQPIRLLFALAFEPPAALMWEIGFCLALGGVSTYLFLREFHLVKWAGLLGAVGQMFSGVSMIFVRNLALHRSVCLLPLGMLLAERWARTRSTGAALGFSVVLALQLLSGHPTTAMITIVGTTLYLVARVAQQSWQAREVLPASGRQLGTAASGWIAAVVLGIGLAAIQVVPTLLHTRHSIREGGLTFEYAVGGLPAQPGYLVQAAFPYAFEQGDRLETPTPLGLEINVAAFSNMYVGILPLLLACVALWHIRHRAGPTFSLAVCFLAATAFALGPRTPLFPALWSVPGLDGMRYPSRFLFLSAFCLSCLGALGLHHVVALGRLRRSLRWFPPIVVPAGGLGVLAGLLWVRRPEFRTGIAVSLALWAAAALLAWLLVAAGRRRRILMPVVIAAAIADLWALRAFAAYAPTFPIAEAVDPPASARAVQQDEGPFRVLSLVSFESGINRNEQFRDLLMANLSSVWDIDSGGAWASLFPLRYYMLHEQLVWELTHSPASAHQLASFLGALNIRYVVSRSPAELPGWERVFDSERAHIWKNPKVLPRAFLVGNVVPEALEVRPEWEDRANRRLEPYRVMVVDWWSRRPDAQIVDHIRERGIDYGTTAVVEGAGMRGLPGSRPQFTVDELTVPGDTDRLRFRVRSDRPALLVISNSHAPGWTATVDGRDAEIVRANWIVQGVYVPEGESEVALSYTAPGWRAGGAVSVLSLLLAGVAYGASRRWRGATRPTSSAAR